MSLFRLELQEAVCIEQSQTVDCLLVDMLSKHCVSNQASQESYACQLCSSCIPQICLAV